MRENVFCFCFFGASTDLQKIKKHVENKPKNPPAQQTCPQLNSLTAARMRTFTPKAKAPSTDTAVMKTGVL